MTRLASTLTWRTSPVSDAEISRHPTWHGLRDNKMPPFPEHIVRTVLASFGITQPEFLDPWPYGPFDILARFTSAGMACLLKGRHVEQRGERSLFETHHLQRRLLDLGVPVAPLVAAPSGHTLLKGPDWEEDGEIYYEVQQVLGGEFCTSDVGTLYRAGLLLATFHQAGEQIDTYLLNKSMYVQTFQQRRFQAQEHLREQLRSSGYFSVDEDVNLAQLLDRARDTSWRCRLSWGLVHGDMSVNNLLVADGQLFLLDLDEIGLGERIDDLIDLLLGLPEIGRPVVESLLRGYREGGGFLNEHDLQALYDALVFSALKNRSQICHLGKSAAVFLLKINASSPNWVFNAEGLCSESSVT